MRPGGTGAALSHMSALYRAYADRLVGWISALENGGDVEVLFEALSRMEGDFIGSAHEAGTWVDEERVRVQKRAGRVLSIREAAEREGELPRFEEASASVAEAARLRVTALRIVERIRDGLGDEIEKNAGARKLVRKYTHDQRSGRKVNGRV